MSEQGIKLAAQAFSIMQEIRIRLIGLLDTHGKIDKQNVVLGQMFEDINATFKDKFMAIADNKLYKNTDEVLP